MHGRLECSPILCVHLPVERGDVVELFPGRPKQTQLTPCYTRILSDVAAEEQKEALMSFGQQLADVFRDAGERIDPNAHFLTFKSTVNVDGVPHSLRITSWWSSEAAHTTFILGSNSRPSLVWWPEEGGERANFVLRDNVDRDDDARFVYEYNTEEAAPRFSVRGVRDLEDGNEASKRSMIRFVSAAQTSGVWMFGGVSTSARAFDDFPLRADLAFKRISPRWDP